ncbi:hypothetical protein AAG570_006485 [Ranatra chinensis]|uniref:Cytochrome P450 n=1 Tax=Ranatra chinensis TaxID=642074 RepID=A0ABD0YU74_9HEMI
MVGTFSLTNPVLLVRDPRLVDKIMATDFSHFVDRGLASDAQASPIDLGLVTMTGASWKAARQKLSPVFSSGKLKTMFEQVSLTAQAIIGYIEKAGGAEMNVKEITSMYSTDVTASCFFGLDVGATLGADNEFRRQALRAFDMTYPQFLKFLLTLNLPSWIGRRLGGSLTPPDLAAYFGDIIAHAIKARKENDIRRSDILQLLLDIREKGTVEPTRSATAVDPDDEYLAMGGNRENKESSEFNDDSVAAHAYTFLTAGLDTSTLALCFCIMQLSLHQDVQEKARDEVRKVLGSKSWPTYLDLKAMSYLENCILETMRLYPAVAILFRQCTKDYTFEDGVTLKAGDSLVLPILGIHTDPNYFDDPMKYRPERHSESKFQRGTFFPFGDGPRICIGNFVASTIIFYKLPIK